jgi:hypothetical protein
VVLQSAAIRLRVEVALSESIAAAVCVCVCVLYRAERQSSQEEGLPGKAK